MHLNPVRAGLLQHGERLLAYPWSSLMWYLAAPGHRRRWTRVDRLLAEHAKLRLFQRTARDMKQMKKRTKHGLTLGPNNTSILIGL